MTYKFNIPFDVKVGDNHEKNSIEYVFDKFWSNVKLGNYNSLNTTESKIIRAYYLQQLQNIFPEALAIPIPKLKTGEPIISAYKRIVIGDHGQYFEFTENQLLIPLVCKDGQEFRNYDENYCKYLWLRPVADENVKIYKQLRTVKYADYKVGYYYLYVFDDGLSY